MNVWRHDFIISASYANTSNLFGQHCTIPKYIVSNIDSFFSNIMQHTWVYKCKFIYHIYTYYWILKFCCNIIEILKFGLIKMYSMLRQKIFQFRMTKLVRRINRFFIIKEKPVYSQTKLVYQVYRYYIP